MALVDPIEGFGLVLRCVEESDAQFALDLRADPDLTQYLPSLTISVEQQEAWIRGQRERPGDWYFVAQRKFGGQPEGFISVYAFDDSTKRAEWGRWILRPGSLAAWECEYLMHKFCFEIAGLAENYCRTITLNERALSNHDRMGMVRHATLPSHFELRGEHYDAIEHVMTAERWAEVREANEAQAKKFARVLGAPRGS
jgi:RimJ/RimL family protein N-acetyltransferase